METEIIICPNCSKPTIKQRSVYETDKIIEIPLKEYAERILKWERSKPHQSSGDIFFGGRLVKAIQFVFTCSTCGYTEVHDV